MLKRILSVIKPLPLLLSPLCSLLGVGVAHYLGFFINWELLIWLWLWLTTINLGAMYLQEYFLKSRRTWLKNQKINNKSESGGIDINSQLRILFLLGIVCLAVSLIPLINLIYFYQLDLLILSMFGLMLFIIWIIELKTEWLDSLGLTIFVNAFLYANLIPSISYLLQTYRMHRFLFLVTFPLFFIFLALFIVISLEELKEDNSKLSATLAGKLGVINYLRLHNIVIMFVFIILLLETFIDLPWRLVWPPLLVLPIAWLQIWQVNQIARGKRIALNLLVYTAIASATLTTYFITLALWLN